MTGSPGELEADDATRISRLYLESLREGRLDDARIQIEALHDVTPREPRHTFNARGELEAELEPRGGDRMTGLADEMRAMGFM